MTDLRHDGAYLVQWVPAANGGTGGINDIQAPTTTELQAGISLECRLTPSGLTREASTEGIDNSKLCDTFSTQLAGRRSFNISVTFVRQVDGTGGGVEDALTYSVIGFLVVRDNVYVSQSPDFQTGDTVEVYPVQIGQPTKSSPAPNELQTMEVPFFMRAEPALDATVG